MTSYDIIVNGKLLKRCWCFSYVQQLEKKLKEEGTQYEIKRRESQCDKCEHR